MRHDYDLPADWEAMTPEERNDWFIQERCRRQALAQDTAWSRKARAEMGRERRRMDARNTHTLGDE